MTAEPNTDQGNDQSNNPANDQGDDGGNQGEGNRKAAARFNEAERRFVESAPGKNRIHEGTHVTPQEEPQLKEAEQIAKARAKAQDSNRM